MTRAHVAVCLLLGVTLSLAATPARAEYRAYELEVVDVLDCRANKRERCRTARVTTALDAEQYLLTHGGPYHLGVLLLATWMCRGDTSTFHPVCQRPATRQPRFQVGEPVRIGLEKHITEGWQGQVEVAYYQASVRSNVYGVRFPDRRHVYARYYEQDLRKLAEAPAAGAPGAGAATPAGAAAGAQGAAPAGAPAAQAAQPQAAPPPAPAAR